MIRVCAAEKLRRGAAGVELQVKKICTGGAWALARRGGGTIGSL